MKPIMSALPNKMLPVNSMTSHQPSVSKRLVIVVCVEGDTVRAREDRVGPADAADRAESAGVQRDRCGIRQLPDAVDALAGRVLIQVVAHSRTPSAAGAMSRAGFRA